MSNLRDLTLPKHTEKASKLKDVKILLKEDKPKTGKVYPSDKIFAIFPKDLKPPIVESKDWKANLKAFLSRNPHLKFLWHTKSYYTPGKQYWFLNTENNIRIIVSEEDINNRKNLTERVGNGYDITIIKKNEEEKIRNAYCRKI
jgi:hypothetical protein